MHKKSRLINIPIVTDKSLDTGYAVRACSKCAKGYVSLALALSLNRFMAVPRPVRKPFSTRLGSVSTFRFKILHVTPDFSKICPELLRKILIIKDHCGGRGYLKVKN